MILLDNIMSIYYRGPMNLNEGTTQSCPDCHVTVHSPGKWQIHLKSVQHQKIRLINAMLRKDCITFTAIARRLGVHREYVAQIARRLGMPSGHTRISVCNLRNYNPQLLGFFKKAKEKGFPVVPVTPQRKGFVNGILCEVKTATVTSKGYLQINPVRSQAQICVYFVRHRDGYIIIPRCKMPRRQTLFSADPLPAEQKRRGGNCYRHDYWDYYENWDVFDNDFT